MAGQVGGDRQPENRFHLLRLQGDRLQPAGGFDGDFHLAFPGRHPAPFLQVKVQVNPQPAVGFPRHVLAVVK